MVGSKHDHTIGESNQRICGGKLTYVPKVLDGNRHQFQAGAYKPPQSRRSVGILGCSVLSVVRVYSLVSRPLPT